MYKQLKHFLTPWLDLEFPHIAEARVDEIRRTIMFSLIALLTLFALQAMTLLQLIANPYDTQALRGTLLFGINLIAIALIIRWSFADLINRDQHAKNFALALGFALVSLVSLSESSQRMEAVFMWQAIYPLMAAHFISVRATLVYAALACALCAIYVVIHWAQLPANTEVFSILAAAFIYIWILASVAVGFRRIKDARANELRAMNELLEQQVLERTSQLASMNEELKIRTNVISEVLEDVKSANQFKTDFMRNMNHEIRTPLNAIIGITEMLSEGRLSPQQDKQVADLRIAGNQLEHLFSGILDITQLQDHSGDAKTGDVELDTLCHHICAPFVAQADAKELEFNYRLHGEEHTHVAIDEDLFKRAMEQLIDNAIKFTDKGKVTVDIQLYEDQLRVRVRDTGCGMDLNREEELRQPFVQGDSSSTKKHGGFGLGLALSDQCIKQLGGKLIITSTHEIGSCVQFKVPVTILQREPEESRSKTDALAGGTNAANTLPILVVEDNEVNSAVLEAMLRRLGYECDICEDGIQALALYEDNRFYSAILMDCQMPIMDGFETTRRIREIERDGGINIPIIAVTANAMPEDRTACLDAGMDDYLIKPLRIQELKTTLERHITTTSRQPKVVAVDVNALTKEQEPKLSEKPAAATQPWHSEQLQNKPS